MIKHFDASYMTDNSLLYEHADINIDTDRFDTYNDRYVTWESAIRSALMLENSDHRTRLSTITLMREEEDYKKMWEVLNNGSEQHNG